MHIAEVVTIAKSLPLLRLNTYKSLILSYSVDYRRILKKNTTFIHRTVCCKWIKVVYRVNWSYQSLSIFTIFPLLGSKSTRVFIFLLNKLSTNTSVVPNCVMRSSPLKYRLVGLATVTNALPGIL